MLKIHWFHLWKTAITVPVCNLDFEKKKSTEDALLHVMNKAVNSLNENLEESESIDILWSEHRGCTI